MMLYRYKLFCEDEQTWVYAWGSESDPAPTLCPNNTAHVLRADSVSIEQSIDAIKEVVTQFEKNDKDLKLASATAQVDEQTGVAELLIPVPASGRWIDEGTGFFSPSEPQKLAAIEAVAPAGGLPADALYPGSPEIPEGAPIKSYHDDEAPEENQGWRVPMKADGGPLGEIVVDTMAGYGWIPGGLVLKVVGKMSGSAPFSGWFSVNIKWGKQG